GMRPVVASASLSLRWSVNRVVRGLSSRGGVAPSEATSSSLNSAARASAPQIAVAATASATRVGKILIAFPLPRPLPVEEVVRIDAPRLTPLQVVLVATRIGIVARIVARRLAPRQCEERAVVVTGAGAVIERPAREQAAILVVAAARAVALGARDDAELGVVDSAGGVALEVFGDAAPLAGAALVAGRRIDRDGDELAHRLRRRPVQRGLRRVHLPRCLQDRLEHRQWPLPARLALAPPPAGLR